MLHYHPAHCLDRHTNMSSPKACCRQRALSMDMQQPPACLIKLMLVRCMLQLQRRPKANQGISCQPY